MGCICPQAKIIAGKCECKPKPSPFSHEEKALAQAHRELQLAEADYIEHGAGRRQVAVEQARFFVIEKVDGLVSAWKREGRGA